MPRRNFLIGNSIVRGVSSNAWHTISVPGYDWEDVALYIRRRRTYFRDSDVYIHVGPVRLTRLHRTQNRRECVLKCRHLSPPEQVFSVCSNVCATNNIVLILCTIYPINFVTYNNHLTKPKIRGGPRGRLIMQASYNEYDFVMRGLVVAENRKIVAFNERRMRCTPFMHRTIYNTRRRRRYAFRDRLLVDGLHPTQEVREDWVRQLGEAVMKNNP